MFVKNCFYRKFSTKQVFVISYFFKITLSKPECKTKYFKTLFVFSPWFFENHLSKIVVYEFLWYMI